MKREFYGYAIGILLGAVLMSAIALVVFNLLPKINTVSVPATDIDLGIVQDSEINMSKVDRDIYEARKLGVENILLIGIDGNNYKNARSDVMIIATIDKDNHVLKLTSVMRDTLSYMPSSNDYQKMNHSYINDGPIGTMKAINKNLDLDIKNFVTFNYNSLMEAVDFIGGFPVVVNSGEAKDMGISTGQQLLFGENALNYVRVRKNSGGDAGRNQRQRDLIMYIMETAKQMKKTELIRFANKMLPLVETSYAYSDIEELVDLYVGMKDSLITEQYSFPYEYRGVILKDKLWYAVPINMKTNVTELHTNLFGEDNGYVTSNTVNEISDYIEDWSGIKK